MDFIESLSLMWVLILTVEVGSAGVGAWMFAGYLRTSDRSEPLWAAALITAIIVVGVGFIVGFLIGGIIHPSDEWVLRRSAGVSLGLCLMTMHLLVGTPSFLIRRVPIHVRSISHFLTRGRWM